MCTDHDRERILSAMRRHPLFYPPYPDGSRLRDPVWLSEPGLTRAELMSECSRTLRMMRAAHARAHPRGIRNPGVLCYAIAALQALVRFAREPDGTGPVLRAVVDQCRRFRRGKRMRVVPVVMALARTGWSASRQQDAQEWLLLVLQATRVASSRGAEVSVLSCADCREDTRSGPTPFAMLHLHPRRCGETVSDLLARYGSLEPVPSAVCPACGAPGRLGQRIRVSKWPDTLILHLKRSVVLSPRAQCDRLVRHAAAADAPPSPQCVDDEGFDVGRFWHSVQSRRNQSLYEYVVGRSPILRDGVRDENAPHVRGERSVEMKNHRSVRLRPTETIDGTPYELFSVVAHEGAGTRRGHYWNYSKNHDGSSWQWLDDAHSRRISFDTINAHLRPGGDVRCHSHLLFFRRRGCTPTSAMPVGGVAWGSSGTAEACVR